MMRFQVKQQEIRLSLVKVRTTELRVLIWSRFQQLPKFQQFQPQKRLQKRMGVRFFHHGKSLKLAQRRTAREDRRSREIEHIMGNLLSVLKDQNATADALRARFKVSQDMELDHVIPFSSDRKYSGAAFKDTGTYLMGAVQFLFPEGNPELAGYCSGFAKEGLRVLVVAHSENVMKALRSRQGLSQSDFFFLRM